MHRDAIYLFEKLNEKPNEFVLMALFNACARYTDSRGLQIGMKAFSQMDKKHRENVLVMTSAMDMFIKHGDIKNAEIVFQNLPSKDVIKYGAMMKGYNMNDEYLKT